MIKMGKDTTFTINGQQIEPGVIEASIVDEGDHDRDEYKPMRYSGELTIKFDEEAIRRITPYSSMFKSIKMPDGEYLKKRG